MYALWTRSHCGTVLETVVPKLEAYLNGKNKGTFFAPRVLFFRLGKKRFGSWNRSPRNRLHNCPSKHVTLKNTISAKTHLKWLFLRGNTYFWCSRLLLFFLGASAPEPPLWHHRSLTNSQSGVVGKKVLDPIFTIVWSNAKNRQIAVGGSVGMSSLIGNLEI